MRTFFNMYTLSLISLGLMASCSTEGTPSSGRTPLTLKITDAPANYDAIFLNIDDIEIRTSGGQSVIDIDGFPFDILRYRFGKDTILANHDVPSGFIQEIRLKLEDTGNSIVVDGQTYPLTTPSGQSSGVKIKIQDELIPDVAYTLLLDFDASKSIVETGNGKYILKPVIRAVPVAVSGTAKGIVLPIAAFPKVYAINGTDTIGTIPNEFGNFYFPGIPEGNYKILFEPTVATYSPQIIENIVIEKGIAKDLGTITLQTK